MIIIDKTIISSDIYEEQFICDLDKCKGACCVEGDLGAPLELKELPLIESAVKKAKNYLSNESKEILEKDGAYILDEEGDFSTTTLKGKECSFAFYDDEKTLKKKITDLTKNLHISAKKGQWSKSSENGIKALGRMWGAYQDWDRNNG